MVCKHCGAAAAEGDLHCRSCGMPLVEEITQPVQTPVDEVPNQVPVEELHYQTPVQQDEPVISLNTEAEVSKPKKKGKIIAIVIIAVLLAAAVFAALNFTAIKVWYTRTFNSPEEIMTAIYKDGVTNSISSFSGFYEKLNATAKNGDATVEGEVHLKLGEQLLSMAEQALGSDTSWLADIALYVTETQNGQYSQNTLALGLGDKSIISFESIYDSTSNLQWFGFPELNEQMVRVEATEDPLSMNQFATTSTMAIESYPSIELIEQLYSKIIDHILNGFASVEAKTESLTVGGLTEDVYVLESKMSEETLKQVCIRILEELKQNPDVKAYLDSITAEYIASMTEMYEEAGLSVEDYLLDIDMYADFVEQIDNEIANLQEIVSQSKPENYLILYTYLNERNEPAGVKMEVFGGDSDLRQIRTLTLNDGEQFAYEYVFDDICITGSGTIGELYNGRFTISEEEEIMSFEIIDAIINQDRCKGKFRIVPGEMLMDEISGDVDSAAGALLNFANLALEVEVDADTENANVKGSVLLGTVEFMSVEISSVTKPAEEVTAPENSVDGESSEALEVWAADMDIQKVLTNLSEAGFPDELMMMILQEIMAVAAGI